MSARLPLPALRELAAWLPPAEIRTLRSVSRTAAVVVARCTFGGAGRVEVTIAAAQQRFVGMQTSRLGRALLVHGSLFRIHGTRNQAQIVEALAEAVQRGHSISFESGTGRVADDVEGAAIAMLAAASDRNQLVAASLRRAGWSVAAMARLSVIGLIEPPRETVVALAGAGILREATLFMAHWGDVSVLQTLHAITLSWCSAVEDLAPLARVPRLVVHECRRIRALPTMRNRVLKVSACEALEDVSALAGSVRVRRLVLRNLPRVPPAQARAVLEAMGSAVVVDGVSIGGV